MSLKHKTHHDYAADVGPKLQQFIEQQRDRPFENVLGEAFMLFSWVMEDFEAKTKTTQQKEMFKKLGIILIEMQDALRGLHAGQVDLSAVTVAALARIIFELRCNLRFIFTRKDPALYADRFNRFAGIEKLVHDDRKLAGQRMLSPAERDRIQKDCPEWIKRKKSGEIRYDLNWTADPQFDSFKKIAEAAGLLTEWEIMYDVTSKFVHGSPLLVNGYRSPNGHVGPIGRPDHVKQTSAIGAKWAIDALMDAARFFGVPFERFTQAQWWARLIAASKELLPPELSAPLPDV